MACYACSPAELHSQLLERQAAILVPRISSGIVVLQLSPIPVKLFCGHTRSTRQISSALGRIFWVLADWSCAEDLPC